MHKQKATQIKTYAKNTTYTCGKEWECVEKGEEK